MYLKFPKGDLETALVKVIPTTSKFVILIEEDDKRLASMLIHPDVWYKFEEL